MSGSGKGTQRNPFYMVKHEPDAQYTPRGLKIPLPTRGELDANLDRLRR
jgi:hypothetical protein